MSDRLKIAVLGAGAGALTPGAFHDALIEHRLDGIDLALFDPSEDVLYPMADLGRRMAGRHKVDATVTPHNDRLAALAGAAFVILGDLSLAPADQADDRLETDAKVCRAFAPAEPITAFGGVAGISHTLRQIALVQRLCDDVTRLAGKGAMLLNLADPLPRLCQAAR